MQNPATGPAKNMMARVTSPGLANAPDRHVVGQRFPVRAEVQPRGFQAIDMEPLQVSNSKLDQVLQTLASRRVVIRMWAMLTRMHPARAARCVAVNPVQPVRLFDTTGYLGAVGAKRMP